MSRISIAMLMAALAVVALAGRVSLADEAKCEGTIAKVEGNSVTVKATNDAQHELTLSPATKITLDGKPAKSTDLKVGQKVKCTANKEGNKLACLSIEASSS